MDNTKHPLWPDFRAWVEQFLIHPSHQGFCWEAFLAGAKASREYEVRANNHRGGGIASSDSDNDAE